MSKISLFLRVSGFFLFTTFVYGKAGEPLEHKERHLGPTGMYGVTTETNITVVRVEAGSPADGRVTVGQVITGFAGVPIQGNTRKTLAAAIDVAQSPAGGGQLVLNFATGGSATIALAVEGVWSATSPSSCVKCDAMVARAAQHVLTHNDIGRYGFGLLGVLATGEQALVDQAAAKIRSWQWAQPTVSVRTDRVGNNWANGMITMVLAEYYKLTQDAFVLPALEKFAVGVALGAEGGGLWGHNPPIVPGGKSGGYAAIHAVSSQCFLALVLAENAGVSDPRVRKAIEKARDHFRSYIYRGGMSYWPEGTNIDEFSDNGISGILAIALSLDGDLHGAEYFSRVCMTHHRKIEKGHTGHYFAQLWCGLGAHVSGPLASTRFFERTRWLTTMNKRWDGNFTYDDSERSAALYSYSGLSMAGSHLINLCRKRRVLMITGRGADPALTVSDAEVEETVGLFESNMGLNSNAELFRLLQNPVRHIRTSALSVINNRSHDLEGSILGLMDGNNDFGKMGAIHYISTMALGSGKKGKLIAIMNDMRHSLLLRFEAAEALLATKAMNLTEFQSLLSFFMADHVDDKYKVLQGRIGKKLDICFLGIGVNWPSTAADYEQFYELIHVMGSNPYDYTRVNAMHCVKDVSDENFYRVAALVRDIARNESDHYASHAWYESRKLALRLLGSKGIEEGMQISLNLFSEPSGTYNFQSKVASSGVTSYGLSGRKYLEQIRATNWAAGDQWSINRYITLLESDQADVPMVSLESKLWESLQAQGSVDESMWRRGQFTDGEQNSGMADPGADPDGDGYTNRMEYALGTNPMKHNGGLLDLEDINGRMFFTYDYPAQVSDMEVSLEVSHSLNSWRTEASDSAELSSGRMQIKTNADLGVGRSMFGRLKVSPK